MRCCENFFGFAVDADRSSDWFFGHDVTDAWPAAFFPPYRAMMMPTSLLPTASTPEMRYLPTPHWHRPGDYRDEGKSGRWLMLEI